MHGLLRVHLGTSRTRDAKRAQSCQPGSYANHTRHIIQGKSEFWGGSVCPTPKFGYFFECDIAKLDFLCARLAGNFAVLDAGVTFNHYLAT